MKNFYDFKTLFFQLLKHGVFLFAGMGFYIQADAVVFNVNSTGDTHATNLASGTDAGGFITLRSALEAATATAGSHVINVPAGTINLTLGQITVGDAAAGNNITVSGAGIGNTKVNQTTAPAPDASRIFSTGIGAITFFLSNMWLNYASTGTRLGGGGAIIAGGAGASTSIQNVRFSNFNLQIGNGGAVSQSSSLAVHNLTLTGCLFENNICGGAGGAVSFNSQGGTCIITNCTFSNNQTGNVGVNTGGGGGAVSVTGGGTGGTYTITKSTFINNHSNAQGGAIINTNGVLSLSYCRLVGNNASVATNGNELFQVGGSLANTITANNNWWGINTGPAANDVAVGAPPVTAPAITTWLQLKATAPAASLCPNASTLVTASFLSNSAGTPIPLADIPVLISLPISFTPTLGTLSGAQTTIQANGTATVTFTAGAVPGAGAVNAVVDQVPNNDATAKASINILTPASVGTAPTNQTVCIGGTATFNVVGAGSATLTYQWRKGVTNLVNGATGSGSTISGATTNTLQITNAQLADAAANYNVVVSNACAGPVSANVSLTVNTPAGFSQQPSATYMACSGDSIRIAATASGTGPFTYQWRKGLVPLANGATGTGSTLAGVQTNALIIYNAGTLDNAANYNVIITGACGSATSNNATVTVTQNSLATSSTSNPGFMVSPNHTVINDPNCKLIAKMVPSGAAPVNGAVPSYVTIDASVMTASDGRPYVQRHYDFNPANNAANATATLTLYYTQTEFNAFNAFPGNGPDLPTGPSDDAGKANVRVFQYHGVGFGNPNTPSTYPGPGVEINPADGDIVWNAGASRWEVTIGVTGFSGFFLSNVGVILPVHLLSFNGKLRNGDAELQWLTTAEVNTSHFELQRSTDGRNFSRLGDIQATGNSNTQTAYSYRDQLAITAPGAQRVWYRLNTIDKNGTSSMSNTVLLNIRNNGFNIVVLPNPFGRLLKLQLTSPSNSQVVVAITDMSGKLMYNRTLTLQTGNNNIDIREVQAFANGTYMMRISNEKMNETIKLVKAE